MAKIESKIIEIKQPIGTFYIGKVKAVELRGAVKNTSRSNDQSEVQRDVNPERLKEIVDYCQDPDATFPTAILLSIDTSISGVSYELKNECLRINYETEFGEVIDGQHRLNGMWNSGMADKFELPVVFMLDPTLEEKAYIFSIINSKQAKVNPSLIFDLFDVSLSRSPQKTVHEIARSLNGRPDSPFYNRLKMLGKATPDQENAILSQGTFSKRLITLISKKPQLDSIKIKRNEKLEVYDPEKYIFRSFFIKNQDSVILKILLNCFNALKNVFPEYWEKPKDNILWKTTGFNAIIDALPKIFRYGLSIRKLTEPFFYQIFTDLKNELESKKIELTSSYFGSGEKETRTLSELIKSIVPEN